VVKVLGHFRYAGEVYEGIHEPIITKQLFDRVAAILNRRWKCSPSELKRVPKPYLQLLHCARCGGAITAEVQKGHTYYRCSKKILGTERCTEPYIREEALDRQISDLIKPFTLPADWADWMLKRVKEENQSSAQSAAKVCAAKQAEIEKINLRLQRLLDSFLDGIIERNDFTSMKSKLMSERKTLQEQSSALATDRAEWLEPFQIWVLTARDAGEIAVSGSLQEKRVLALKIFGSNLVLDGKIARGSCVKPWSHLPEKLQTGGLVPVAGLEPARLFTVPGF
jgi:site-specific DNA recombinase